MIEAELLAAVSDVLGRLRFETFEIRLNHRRALTALLDCAGVPGPLHAEALIALDKLDKVGADGVEIARKRRPAGTRKSVGVFSVILPRTFSDRRDNRAGSSGQRRRATELCGELHTCQRQDVGMRTR